MVGTLNKNDQAYGDNNLYHIGKILSDIGSIAVGGVGMAGGGALAGVGVGLDVTGAGAVIGVPANIAGVAIASGSAAVATSGTQNIVKDASDLISNIKSGAGKGDVQKVETYELETTHKITMSKNKFKKFKDTIEKEWLFDIRQEFEDPFGMVEEIYADFDYPEEIAKIVRYMPVSAGESGFGEDYLKLNWVKYLAGARGKYGR